MNILHKSKALFLTKLPNITFYLKTIAQISVVAGLAAAIWLAGPALIIHGVAPLAQPEKRFYLIIFLFLAWLLKFLLIDLDASHTLQFLDSASRKKLKSMQNRFQGVMQFLKQTTVNRHGQQIKLNQLPWFFLIGPQSAGKTSLLAHSRIHFVLQRQLQKSNNTTVASEQCDWWVTRDASIIDVPGNYLALPAAKTGDDKPTTQLALWRSLLRLTRKNRGKDALAGLLIALPLPELMRQGDPKRLQTQLKHLFLRITELKSWFPQAIPCYLVITKCDLLPGFQEFFAESSDDELAQTWGLTLPTPRSGEKAHDLFASRFDSLIKKLNQQLLWRLHQERNPMARPYIKDFPLQVERLKEVTLDFIKKFISANTGTTLKSVYLTSALQPATETEDTIIDAVNSNQRALQLFKGPTEASRPYFIKQFLMQGLQNSNPQFDFTKSKASWKRRTAYVASIGAIGVAAAIFGKDFQHAVMQAYSVQNTLSAYQLAMQQTHDADEHLLATLNLLNALKQSANKPAQAFDVDHVLSFYSNKAKNKSSVVYTRTLQTILMPEIHNYLGEYLKKPINKNTDDVYAALKSYLMLNDLSHFQADFITQTLQNILPKTLRSEDAAALLQHVHLALNNSLAPLPTNEHLVAESRRYLNALPSFQLGYIILKNIDNNNVGYDVNLGAQSNMTAVFNHRLNANQVPKMFTVSAFTNIFNQETALAAQEATVGNWVLGTEPLMPSKPEDAAMLLQQLRNTYVNNYVDVWENILANIHLNKPKDLAQTDAIIINLTSSNSPLLKLLQTLHDNTYFDPIASTSNKLQSVGLLIEKNNQSSNQLYQIFSGLQGLHLYINKVLTADNPHKAAFEAVSARMQHANDDAITQLRLIADKSPEPIKNWLNNITNDTWHYLLQEATHYIDMSWQQQVAPVYEEQIANHYPFNTNATQEVPLQQFTEFFGNPGTLIAFYNQYLMAFIDSTNPEWRWKNVENHKVPFSDEALRQIQSAYNIHHMFFPNGDNKLYVQFALQPYQLSKFVKKVKLSINDKHISDNFDGPKTPHLLSWPSKHDAKMTSVQFTMLNKKVLNRDFPGDWGWFKLVNQSIISSVTSKELIIDLSEKKFPVKYLLFTNGKHNPFVTLNTSNLQLPKRLIVINSTEG